MKKELTNTSTENLYSSITSIDPKLALVNPKFNLTLRTTSDNNWTSQNIPFASKEKAYQKGLSKKKEVEDKNVSPIVTIIKILLEIIF